MKKRASVLKKWRRRLKPSVAALSLRAFGALPIMLNRRIGGFVGFCLAFFDSNYYQISLDNISKAFPDLSPQQQKSLAKKSIIETTKNLLEIASVWRRPYSSLKQRILRVENLELIQGASPKGLLLLAPHLGNWELLGSFLAQHVDITIIYEPSNLEAVDNLVIEGRCREGVKLAPANLKGVAMVIKALREGKCVGILPDQVPYLSNARIAAKFFGKDAWTMTLVHKLIQKTSCKTVMGVAKRVPEGFDIIFSPADEKITSDDELESITALNRSVENCVRVVPEQYQWEYKRYKRI